MSASGRGSQRERAVRDHLAKQDWLAFRAPASLGCADVIALRDGSRPRLVEVKSTAGGPYEHFGPAARERLAVRCPARGRGRVPGVAPTIRLDALDPGK